MAVNPFQNQGQYGGIRATGGNPGLNFNQRQAMAYPQMANPSWMNAAFTNPNRPNSGNPAFNASMYGRSQAPVQAPGMANADYVRSLMARAQQYNASPQMNAAPGAEAEAADRAKRAAMGNPYGAATAKLQGPNNISASIAANPQAAQYMAMSKAATDRMLGNEYSSTARRIATDPAYAQQNAQSNAANAYSKLIRETQARRRAMTNTSVPRGG